MNVWSSAKDPHQTHIWESSAFFNLNNTNLAEHTHTFIWASQVALVVKNLPANAEDVKDASAIPGWGRSPRGGHGNPLQYSCLENPMDRGTWWAAVQMVAKSWT